MLNIIMKYLVYLSFSLLSLPVFAQSDVAIVLDVDTKYQTVEGFGASLAYYENWLVAHPNKSEIYDAIFGELSLDILRVRNAHGYDDGMIDRVVEFYNAAENVLGQPIKLLSTSWGPPAYLKSNNDTSNGGTLKYQLNGNAVEFDYAGFAEWWSSSLDEYNENDIFPDFISLQNEPDFAATWESCVFRPTEIVNATDTLAGYNKALEAIYNMVEQREEKPKILGPEGVGIGYNSIQNFINSLNTDYLYGIAHHLYHGVDEYNPWVSTEFSEVGSLHEELPHFQTEFSRGDWFSLGGLMHKSFNDENVVAYFYWDLIWEGKGLVDLEFPWDKSRWTTEEGYIKTKEFYAFKQYSAFIHPNWTRISSSNEDDNIKTLAFINPAQDSISLILVNRSETDPVNVSISVDDFDFKSSAVYRTSENDNGSYLGVIDGSNLTLPAKSITSIQLTTSEVTSTSGFDRYRSKASIYPNPVSSTATIKLPEDNVKYDIVSVIDSRGSLVKTQRIGAAAGQQQDLTIDCSVLPAGLYYYQIASRKGAYLSGKFIVKKE